MAVEIEAKKAVEKLDVTRAKLKERGAKRIGAFAEVNTFFDSDDRSLLAADKGLRVRLNRNTETGEEEHILTYKGPRQHGPLKSREDVELIVEGSTETAKLLACLGFVKTLSFEKRRESWHLDNCKVELDELPYLGTFVEIEGPDEASVMRVRQSLNLADRPPIKYGYVAMLSGYLQERGRTERDIRFGSATA
jgi:adenylate cyclase class 2